MPTRATHGDVSRIPCDASCSEVQRAALTWRCAQPAAGGSTRRVISSDRHIVRMWDAASGANFTSIQPPEPGINDVLHWRGSGLLMLGMDQPNIEVSSSPPNPKPSTLTLTLGASLLMLGMDQPNIEASSSPLNPEPSTQTLYPCKPSATHRGTPALRKSLWPCGECIW